MFDVRDQSNEVSINGTDTYKPLTSIVSDEYVETDGAPKEPDGVPKEPDGSPKETDGSPKETDESLKEIEYFSANGGSNGPYHCEGQCAHDRYDKGILSPASRKARKRLIFASVFCVFFIAAEIVGGILANSLALLADAAHFASDFAGFMISILALWCTSRGANSKLSYGWHRAEILGVIISVMLIWGITVFLIFEGVERIKVPEDVDGVLMTSVALVGLASNFVMVRILRGTGHGHSHGISRGHSHSHGHAHGHDDAGEEPILKKSNDERIRSHGTTGDAEEGMNINVRSAMIHVVGDIIQSVGVVVAGALIWYDPEKFKIADPICTFIFSVLVVLVTYRLIRDVVYVLMESTPLEFDHEEIEQNILNVDGVTEIHDLHVWSISVGKPLLTCHIQANQQCDTVLRRVQTMLVEDYEIDHSTIQIEMEYDENEYGPCVHATQPSSPRAGGGLNVRVININAAQSQDE